MKKLLPLLVLAGCATSSPIVPYGKDTYLLTISDGAGMTTSDALRVRAAQEANAHCSKMGKTMSVQNSTKQGSAGWTATSTGLVFSCT